MAGAGSRARRAPARQFLVSLAVIPLLSGCFPEDLGGGLDVVNKTDSTLIVFQHPIPTHGGRFTYETTNCSSSDLSARQRDGTVVAELTEKWCPGQTWTITGEGESDLTSR
jgi:hypothetical protein